MQDASYKEYVRFCRANGLAFVPYEEYGFQFWLDFCKQHRIANAVNDETGMPWAEMPAGVCIAALARYGK